MTDKQLDEYTRLKIEEATRTLQDKYDRLNMSSKEYKTSMYFGDNRTVIATYQDVDDLTKELKEINDSNKKLEGELKDIEKINSELKFSLNTNIDKAKDLQEYNIELQQSYAEKNLFLNDTLFNRLKKAFKGEL